MRDQLVSIQRLALPAITKCFRTMSMAAVQVLVGALPLDLQVKKKHLNARVLRLNSDIIIGSVEIKANEVQQKEER